MSRGHVYVLSNSSMPGLVKVGRTTRDVERRASEIWQTGVPTPFKVELSVLSPDCDGLEKALHRRLSKLRVHGGREFFRGDLGMIVETVRIAHEAQIMCWLQEYLPDHIVAHPNHSLRLSDVGDQMHDSGVPVSEFSNVMCQISSAELATLFDRLTAKRLCSGAERAGEVHANGPH